MYDVIYTRGAVFSALFCAWISLGAYAPVGLADNCPPPRINESAEVRHVHDGDTLRLVDGRKIRLIGIDTPELAREQGGRQRPAQPYADEARSAMIRLLRSADNRVGIGYGIQRQDRYQRTLAHLYLPNGDSVQSALLSQGLATAFTTPPNDSRSPCYRQAESIARTRRLGIWSLPRYQPRTLYQLDQNDRGFRLVEGRVSDVHFGRKAAWIYLGKTLRLRIHNKDLGNFNIHSLRQLPGKTLQVRGWLHPNKDHFFMALRHTDALIIK